MSLNFGRALMGAHATAEGQKLQKEQDAWFKEQQDLQRKQEKKSKGKSLWSSLGGKIGALGGGALGTGALSLMLAPLGPAALPLAAAISSGVGSFAGRKLGEEGYGHQGKGNLLKGGFGLDPSDVRAAGPEVSGGKFHSGRRGGLESSIKTGKEGIIGDIRASDQALHEQQIMGALTDAATAGALKGGSDWMGDLFGGTEIGETVAEEGVDMFFDPKGVSEAVPGIDYRYGGLIK